MNSSGNPVTACRLCQHYSSEGRRGGFCSKLDVPVLSKWEACSLAAHPFETTWLLLPNDINSFLYESLQDTLTIKQAEMAELQSA